MHFLLIALLASSQGVYSAKVTTFACNSASDVSDLLSVRNDEERFNISLIRKLVYGECIAIPKGQVVDGASFNDDEKLLKVGSKLARPGFIAPKGDFESKEDEAYKKNTSEGSGAAAIP